MLEQCNYMNPLIVNPLLDIALCLAARKEAFQASDKIFFWNLFHRQYQQVMNLINLYFHRVLFQADTGSIFRQGQILYDLTKESVTASKAAFLDSVELSTGLFAKIEIFPTLGYTSKLPLVFIILLC